MTPGRVALVTGASRGLGRAIALRLAEEGASVAANFVSGKDGAESVVGAIRAKGGRAITVQADVGNRAQAVSMVGMVERQLGPVDILVNNAGVFLGGELEDFDYERMETMRRTNVDGLVNVTRAVVPGMKLRKWGRIVNLTSIAGIGTAMRGTTFYAATKAAVSVLTRRFAMDLGPHGITVNAIAPGFIITEMATQGRTREEMDAVIAAISAKAMMRRTGEPADIANAAAFLVSEQSSFVTAQILIVDGGRMDYI